MLIKYGDVLKTVLPKALIEQGCCPFCGENSVDGCSWACGSSGQLLDGGRIKVATPCSRYVPELMVVGRRIITHLSYQRWRVNMDICPFCRCDDHSCGFSGTWTDLNASVIQVENVCRNYLQSASKDIKLCTCDIMVIMARGCQCGGV